MRSLNGTTDTVLFKKMKAIAIDKLTTLLLLLAIYRSVFPLKISLMEGNTGQSQDQISFLN